MSIFISSIIQYVSYPADEDVWMNMWDTNTEWFWDQKLTRRYNMGNIGKTFTMSLLSTYINPSTTAEL